MTEDALEEDALGGGGHPDALEDQRAAAGERRGFDLKARAHSFGYAGNGIRVLLLTQVNAWIHATATVAVVVLGLVLGVSALEWCALVIAIVAVWVAESLNTALEFLADALEPDPHPLVGRAKDVAAGGVLISAIGAAVIGVLVLGPRCLAWLGG